MKNIAIYGAGGFGKEVRGMLDMQRELYSFAGYFDDHKDGIEEVKGDQFDDVLMSIADPAIRMRLVNSWSRKKVAFNSLISPDVKLHPSVKVGKGSIICPGVKFTVEIQIGDFVIINLNSTIGHDVVLGNFCSLMPSVNISGNVTLGNSVFVGTGATILQGVTIGDDVIIGAGALVLENIPNGQTVVGVPAKMKRQ
jgi:sugar O-acyltransferase (sialic acid O-acetyltransferase NeuD family)